MSKQSSHIHKFKRLKYKTGNSIFFCTLPDCNVKINVSLALGKRSLCWRCNEPFIMNEYSLRLAKPHCESCHRSKELLNSNIQIKVEETSLSERLSQTIKNANKNTSQIEEDI